LHRGSWKASSAFDDNALRKPVDYMNAEFWRTLFRISALVATLLLLATSEMAQSAGPLPDSNSAASAEVKAFVAQMAEMIVKADWDGYAQRLAPDYLRTNYDGRVQNKNEALASLRDPQRKIIVMEMEPDQRVRVYGDTAVSSTGFTISVRDSGQVKTRIIRMTDVLVKRDGQWYLVGEQATAGGK
jgi:ketosteroid isomerase-like protein